jgi:hypothetical protein
MNPPIEDILPGNPIGPAMGEFPVPDIELPEPNMAAIGFIGPI